MRQGFTLTAACLRKSCHTKLLSHASWTCALLRSLFSSGCQAVRRNGQIKYPEDDEKVHPAKAHVASGEQRRLAAGGLRVFLRLYPTLCCLRRRGKARLVGDEHFNRAAARATNVPHFPKQNICVNRSRRTRIPAALLCHGCHGLLQKFRESEGINSVSDDL